MMKHVEGVNWSIFQSHIVKANDEELKKYVELLNTAPDRVKQFIKDALMIENKITD